MTMERDSLVARLLEHADTQIEDNNRYIQKADELMREAAAALSRPEQVVTDAKYFVEDGKPLQNIGAGDALAIIEDMPATPPEAWAAGWNACAALCLTTAAPLQAVTDEMVERAKQAVWNTDAPEYQRDYLQYDNIMRAALEAALHPAPEAASPEAAAGVEANCPDCNRHIMADPQPATGWLASCGRRLTRLDEFENPSPCRLLAEAASAGEAVGVDGWKWIKQSLAVALQQKSCRDIAKEIGVGPATISRLARGYEPSATNYFKVANWLRPPSDTAPSPKGVSDGVRDVLIAGWNACRKSIYSVCEDVDREAEETYLRASSRGSPTSTEGHLSEFQSGHVSGYRSGMVRAAKSIARGFNSMEAMDDDNLTAALAALSQEPVPATAEERAASKEGA